MNKKWSSNDNTQFPDLNKVEEEIKSLLHTTKKNLIQSSIEEKNYEPEEEKIPIEDTRNDSDLALSSVPDQIDFSNKKPGLSTQRPQYNQILCILYPGQIAFGSRSLL